MRLDLLLIKIVKYKHSRISLKNITLVCCLNLIRILTKKIIIYGEHINTCYPLTFLSNLGSITASSQVSITLKYFDLTKEDFKSYLIGLYKLRIGQEDCSKYTMVRCGKTKTKNVGPQNQNLMIKIIF